MKYSELKETDDCDNCPLKINEICNGGMQCYGGNPIEPPCCSFDDDTDLDEWVKEYFDSQRRREEWEDRKYKERLEKDRLNKIKQQKRNEAKWHVWKETNEIKRLKKIIQANKNIMHFSQSLSDAFNFANECFNYTERVKPRHNEKLELENEQMRKRIKEIELIKKQKLKELRQSREDS